ncbi:hypothetical protein [uncultured Chryseobacterium sp.]|uniref:hypothetical protein n=1 Tax=uncultured Chryseobacterium sp. TaxID=259322 RepID=UPI0025F71594|nr:hypothetical protein [uncultured Chryseobacterium sp.]
MSYEKLDNLLNEYTDYLNTMQKWNLKIDSYEVYGIKTPQKIVSSLKKFNAATNFIIINSECIVIANSFDLSDQYLHKIFFAKAVFRVIHETFVLLKEYNQILFKNDEHPVEGKIAKKHLNTFMKNYDEAYIKKIRDNTGSHYNKDFREHFEIMRSIDLTKTNKMFMDFLEEINKMTIYLTTYVLIDSKESQELNEYLKYVESKLP